MKKDKKKPFGGFAGQDLPEKALQDGIEAIKVDWAYGFLCVFSHIQVCMVTCVEKAMDTYVYFLGLKRNMREF